MEEEGRGRTREGEGGKGKGMGGEGGRRSNVAPPNLQTKLRSWLSSLNNCFISNR